MNSRTERFLDEYRRLEADAAAEYHLSNLESVMSFLMRRPEFRSIRAELDYCREVRNLLSHMPKVGGRYAVEPSEEMIALLERTARRIRNPERAKHICVPKSRMTWRKMSDPVFPAMREMNEKLYSHIPILEDDVVVGVFSENTLIGCLLDAGRVNIDSATRFSDLAKYLPLDAHRAESFRFVGRNTPTAELEAIFAEAQARSERIGLVFVTHSGKPTEKVLGILSPSDMAGVD